MSRDWENWDVGGVASEIEAIWQGSEAELAHRERLVDVVSRYVTRAQTSVLEVGSGTGLVYEKLVTNLPVNIRYTGVDSSIKMLEIARENFPQGQFLYGDGYELVFRDREFDTVLCFEVLGHIPQIEPVVRELIRVAKETCIFTVWPSDSADIAESCEIIDGVKFLHRRYSDAYVKRAIYGVPPKDFRSIDVEPLPIGGTAYIVTL
ncbi:class I SAM-dependent methyltransferase [Mesorhizobium sp. B1-1-5]|uniref:class I SAM-dependent methyltransferase n=1 Tax=Mesorhizobium sp. B1-1-5 TaxID=2589979 RepID=UPI00112C84A7|nr:class I SAM-dependent methyltransferase [Mesorhizobium sp. B1-1-5]TPO12345.1 class I SAM-dependent methyltransferase [Mesorhizobium sp. B1-1-5]